MCSPIVIHADEQYEHLEQVLKLLCAMLRAQNNRLSRGRKGGRGGRDEGEKRGGMHALRPR